MDNRISLSLTDAQWQEAEAALQTLKALFAGKLITLSPKQRKSMSKMGDGSMPFTEKAVQYARQNPEFLPAFVSLDEFEIDFNATRRLDVLGQSLTQLLDRIDDSRLQSGSEAYQAARAFYASVKTAAKANVQGAKSVATDLSERYVRVAKPDGTAPEPEA